MFFSFSLLLYLPFIYYDSCLAEFYVVPRGETFSRKTELKKNGNSTLATSTTNRTKTSATRKISVKGTAYKHRKIR